MIDRFSHPTYLVRRQILQLFGASFEVFDPTDQLAFYSKQKAFKLKEDIRIYTGEDLATEALLIQARHVIDFAATYDVYDSTTGDKVGALQRKGLKSLLKDEWIFRDEQDQEIGRIKEDNMVLAMIRRLVTNLVPQSYDATVGDQPVARFSHHFNPFMTKLTADFSPDVNGVLDRRLGIAAAILLCAVEGKQG